MNLFDLPPYFLVTILQDWVLVSGVCLLDSAFCNEADRIQFHYIVKITSVLECSNDETNSSGTVKFSGFLRQVQIESDLRQMCFLKHAVRLVDIIQLELLQSFHCSEASSTLAIYHESMSLNMFLRSIELASTYGNSETLYFGQTTDNHNSTFYGIQTNDKSWYVGELLLLKDSECNYHFRAGVGVNKSVNGNIYTVQHKVEGENGNEKVSTCTGHGIMNFKCGDEYTGQFINGQPSGYGVHKYPNGECYSGEWLEGRRFGEGVLTLINGDMISGTWTPDYPQRGLTVKYANKNKYVGEISRNYIRSGQGTMSYANGDVYAGTWASNNKHGRGEMKYANGDCYEGMWRNDVFYGHGALKCAGGDVFNGDWADGAKCGTGTMFYSHGARYEGQWRHDLPNGEGRFADDLGWGVQRGVFVNGKYVCCGVCGRK